MLNRLFILLIGIAFVGCDDIGEDLIGEWQGTEENELIVQPNMFVRFNGELYQEQLVDDFPDTYPYVIEDNIVYVNRECWGNDYLTWNKEILIEEVDESQMTFRIYFGEKLMDGVFRMVKTKDIVDIHLNDDSKMMLEQLKD